MWYVMLIYSSVGEHLGCFHLLALKNFATVNMVLPVALQVSAFSSRVEFQFQSGIADCMVVLFLTL